MRPPLSALSPCWTTVFKPCENPRGGGIQKVAKAYGVFMDEELSKKYHFFLDHPVSHSRLGVSWLL